MRIDQNNCEEHFVAYYEGDLTAVEMAIVESFINEHPEWEADFTAYKDAFWAVDEELTFDHTFLLKDENESAISKRIVPLSFYRYAAVLFLFGGISFLAYKHNNFTTIRPNHTIVQIINEEDATMVDNSAKLNEQEKSVDSVENEISRNQITKVDNLIGNIIQQENVVASNNGDNTETINKAKSDLSKQERSIRLASQTEQKADYMIQNQLKISQNELNKLESYLSEVYIKEVSNTSKQNDDVFQQKISASENIESLQNSIENETTLINVTGHNTLAKPIDIYTEEDFHKKIVALDGIEFESITVNEDNETNPDSLELVTELESEDETILTLEVKNYYKENRQDNIFNKRVKKVLLAKAAKFLLPKSISEDKFTEADKKLVLNVETANELPSTVRKGISKLFKFN